jgi:uracil-DNA glycosylase
MTGNTDIQGKSMSELSAPLTPAAFVEQLSRVRLDDVFNPYSQICEIYDKPDAAHIRCLNLIRSLERALELRARTIWVARDLGYKGGRRTGLALTDEAHLDSYRALLDGVYVEKATKGPEVRERTASTIWRMLDRIGEPIFLWNVFPLHPHENGNPMSNRCHAARERKTCASYLHDLVSMLRPEKIVAIGGDAHKAALEIGVSTLKVRHPSYGGQTDFIRQISAAYGINESSDQLELFP